MIIWRETPLKYTSLGMTMNLLNGDGMLPDSSKAEPKTKAKAHDYLLCPACKAYSAVDCGDRERIYCTSCSAYSKLTIQPT